MTSIEPLDAETTKMLASLGYRVEPLGGASVPQRQTSFSQAQPGVPGDPLVWENGLGVTSARQESFELSNPLRNQIDDLKHDEGFLGLRKAGVLLSRASGGTQQFVNNMQEIMLAEQPINQLPGLAFLRRSFIEAEIITITAPDLIFFNWVQTRPTDALDVNWIRDEDSHATDAQREDPIPIAPGSEFPEITTSIPGLRKASLERYGFAMRFTRDHMLNQATAFDLVSNRIERARWWFRAHINNELGNTLTNDFDTAQTGVDAIRVQQAATAWDSGTEDPITDIRDLVLLMEDNADGRFAQPTDLWLPPTNFRQLNDYVTINFNQPFDWVLDPFTRRMVLMVDGIRVHKAPPQSGIPDDFGVMLTDPNSAPPVTAYVKTDPAFSVSGEIQVRQYMDDKTHDEVFQMWRSWVAILRDSWRVGMLYGL